METTTLRADSGRGTRWLAMAALAAGAWGLSAMATQAQARDDVYWSIGVNSPGVSVGVSNAPPVYVQPAPVYVQPAPVYVRPRPVYVQPAPVYVQPAPVYRPGYYVQPVVQPQPVYVYPGWRHGHNKWRDDDRRGPRHRDRDGDRRGGNRY